MTELGFDLKAMRVVAALTQSGSMTIAARQLGMTQPAISHTIKALEDEYNTVLFDRRLRPIRPTAAGTLLAERARYLLAEAEETDRLVRSTDRSTVPQINVGFVDSFSVTVGPKLIDALQDQAQQISMWAGISPGLESDLMQRNLDVIVTPTPMSDIADLENTRLYREPYIIIVPKSAVKKSQSVSLQELASTQPLVRYSLRSRIGTQIDQHLRWLRVEASSRLEFDGSEGVVSMVAEGLGWAITTPLCLIHARAFLNQIDSLPMPQPGFSRSLYLVKHKGEFAGFRRKLVKQTRAILNRMLQDDLPRDHQWMTKQVEIA